MNIDVFCVFPEAVDAALRVGVVGRAIERGVVGYRSFDLRDFSPNGRIDDMPYGGGAGMVVRVDVVARAFEEVYGAPAREVRNTRRVVLTEPAGRPLVQAYVDDIAAGPDLTVVCGRYGGVDERVRTELCTEAVSLGDFVLSGGEIVASALADAVVRRLDGVLGNAESLIGESFSGEGVVGPPMYTRPAVWDGEEVPGVLLSGNHAEIRAWRERESRTRSEARGTGRRSP
ncbi:tRNA (guanosine(37)-N1)-methyltransferase TrmD [Rubrobacter tropicus]|uniref:tRNA (guanosine(37)-N1)-methyltransferase TrmD n=1 Tax=Rubrobacter tropicus TaxID=2653851 RepID=UPI00140B66F0|nr:tRNA (guanosine(37)-N1)-methyltransferase TrmD [Rubrobacter tropicus]